MNQARNTAAARIAAAIDSTLEQLDKSGSANRATRASLVEQVRGLAEALDIVDAGALPALDLTDPEPVLEGLWGDYGWELGHGSETVALTWRGHGGVIVDQATPFEAVLFARSIEAQAFLVLEGQI